MGMSSTKASPTIALTCSVGPTPLVVHVGNISWNCSENVFRKDFEECGKIVKLKFHYTEEGAAKGSALVYYATQAGVDAALKYDGTAYAGRTLYINLAGHGNAGKGTDRNGTGK